MCHAVKNTNGTAAASTDDEVLPPGLVLELERRYPGLGHQVEEGMAVAIDGEIYQDAYLAAFRPDSEIYLIPKIGGG